MNEHYNQYGGKRTNAKVTLKVAVEIGYVHNGKTDDKQWYISVSSDINSPKPPKTVRQVFHEDDGTMHVDTTPPILPDRQLQLPYTEAEPDDEPEADSDIDPETGEILSDMPDEQ